ncbi:peptide deformylase [Vannielia litorea]|uniref:Peptide deformylase n=1 Tax=Vannielia litorea TaxID=1217970 RepID=A0A1N6ILF2_9RHOB|nr:peptide deformylase [Vannielia litorea]SIO32852.1 peptide deformylase [Vannielia litorea]
MSVLPIVLWPDARLKATCAPVAGEDLGTLAADMLDTMYAAPGRGLAGPQVGVLRRIFVMDAGWKAGHPDPRICIDPVVTPLGAETATMEEGCLSIPDHPVQVTRPAHVRLDYTDEAGMARSVVLTGPEAAIAQHEADHLDGKLIIDGEDA